MGGGAWTTASYSTYMKSTRGIDNVDTITTSSVNQFYNSRDLDPSLDPKGVKFRECRDSEEHPNTIPIILGLDVTGSMGSACAAVARQLDKIITSLYADVKDVEFMVMGIGDFAYDSAPLQVSQFESDVRICDQLGKIWFERGGGGNMFESYTAAWYFAQNHTQLDCWNRGKKGIIITMGDERLNPYLPHHELNNVLGCTEQGSIETPALYDEVSKKFDVYHIDVAHRTYRDDGIDSSWAILGDNYKKANMNNISDVITEVIVNSASSVSSVSVDEEGCITW
jgi:hypothetical protein